MSLGHSNGTVIDSQWLEVGERECLYIDIHKFLFLTATTPRSGRIPNLRPALYVGAHTRVTVL